MTTNKDATSSADRPTHRFAALACHVVDRRSAGIVAHVGTQVLAIACPWAANAVRRLEVFVRLFPRLLVLVLVASVAPVCSVSVLASTTAVASCTPGGATLTATPSQANYAPGNLVRVTISLHNRARVACSYVTGPTSPNFVLQNSSGTAVWGSCWFGGGPAPCAFYLVQRVLAPGATYRDRLTWDQRTGHPDLAVPVGLYRFKVTMSGLALRAVTTFRVEASY